jgi:hypothetical protein
MNLAAGPAKLAEAQPKISFGGLIGGDFARLWSIPCVMVGLAPLWPEQ